jgi:acyl-CoA synthetase (AMP-forming)/AMP-acid ligase II
MPISSPPLDYRLDRPGTSGKAVGPQLSIRDKDEGSTALPAGVMGRICVRGPPLFPGYEHDGNQAQEAEGQVEGEGVNKKGFVGDGWFDTGDLGYMDADGYLYITGRFSDTFSGIPPYTDKHHSNTDHYPDVAQAVPRR